MKSIFVLFILASFCESIAMTRGEKKLFSSDNILSHEDAWSVNETSVDSDGVVYKKQGKSLINWDVIDTETWLDYGNWLVERKRRDTLPNWKIRLRESTIQELFGEVLSCVGKCVVHRGSRAISAKARSRLYEGDEFSTGIDSAAWLLMSDGTLLRVSSKTSITLNEVNFSKDESFVYLRLNNGHVKSVHRFVGEFRAKNLSETDLSFYPLRFLEANREFYAREEFSKLDSRERTLYLTQKNLGFYSQYQALNKYLSKKTTLNIRNSTLFLVAPNITLKIRNANCDLFYGINTKSIFRISQKYDDIKLQDKRSSTAFAELRGYKKGSLRKVEFEKWHEVSKKGKQIFPSKDGRNFKALDLLVKRVPSILLAREITLRKRYQYLFEDLVSLDLVAKKYGLRLWNSIADDEMKDREAFLFEYNRRVETTNLSSLEKVFEGSQNEFDSSFYEFSLNQYIFKLKRNRKNIKMIVPELTDSEYYIWVLKHGKR